MHGHIQPASAPVVSSYGLSDGHGGDGGDDE